MSLESLRALRRDGVRPPGVLKVVVGKRVPVVEGDADVIAVPPDAQPHHMDWRPVIGMPLVLLVCEGADPLAERVFDALMAAKCNPVGAVWRDVVVTTDHPTRPVLKKLWEVLCL